MTNFNKGLVCGVASFITLGGGLGFVNMKQERNPADAERCYQELLTADPNAETVPPICHDVTPTIFDSKEVNTPVHDDPYVITSHQELPLSADEYMRRYRVFEADEASKERQQEMAAWAIALATGGALYYSWVSGGSKRQSAEEQGS